MEERPLHHKMYQLELARIVGVKQKYGNRRDMKYLVCDIELAVGGVVENVPFSSGGIDGDTGNPHGIFIPPRLNQIVGVLFADGRQYAPIACFFIPMPSWKLTEEQRKMFNEPMENINDAMICHYSGSRVIIREDGSFELSIKDGNSLKVNIDGSEIIIESIDDENKIVMNSSGIEILAKGDTLSKKAARQGDPVSLSLSGLDLQALAVSLLSTGGFVPASPPIPATVPFSTSNGGSINDGSSNVKIGG